MSAEDRKSPDIVGEIGSNDSAYLNLLDDRIQRLTQAANVARRRELSEMSRDRLSALRSTDSFISQQCPDQEAPTDIK